MVANTQTVLFMVGIVENLLIDPIQLVCVYLLWWTALCTRSAVRCPRPTHVEPLLELGVMMVDLADVCACANHVATITSLFLSSSTSYSSL